VLSFLGLDVFINAGPSSWCLFSYDMYRIVSGYLLWGFVVFLSFCEQIEGYMMWKKASQGDVELYIIIIIIIIIIQ
jgi:hypothetical protein